MKATSMKMLRNVFATTLISTSLLLSSCGTVIDQHGYVAEFGAVEDIGKGMRKSEVVSILGSPSVITKTNGLSYYYISSKFDRFRLLGTKENERQVIAIHFNRSSRVINVAHYGLKDGVVFDFIGKTTPSYKKDLNFIQELFGNVGRFNAGPGSTGFGNGL